VHTRLTLALVAALLAVAAPADARADTVAVKHLGCLTPKAVAAVKRDATRFATLYDGCANQFRKSLGPNGKRLGDTALRYAFATVVAHASAAYGSSTVYALKALLAQKQLDCAGYAALTWQLARSSGASVREVEIVGWDGGTVGNHAQVAYTRAGEQLVLDPTIGLVAFTRMSAVQRGKPVDGADMVLYPTTADAALDTFPDMVISSLYLGTFSADQVIYTQRFPPGQGAEYRAALG
jgi:hypothetical protein